MTQPPIQGFATPPQGPRSTGSWIVRVIVILAVLVILPVCGLFGYAFYRGFKTSQQTMARTSNLRNIALSLIAHANDHKDRLPSMDTTSDLKNALAPYVKGYGNPNELFEDPVSASPLRFNERMSEADLSHLVGQEFCVLVFTPLPDRYGYRRAAFADGHVQAVSGEELRCDLTTYGPPGKVFHSGELLDPEQELIEHLLKPN